MTDRSARLLQRGYRLQETPETIADLRAQVRALPGVPCHRWHEHTDANGGEAHAAKGSGAISRAAVLALLDTVSPVAVETTPEQDAAMWAYQFVGALTTVYEFRDGDVVPLLDHLSAMAEGRATGNEGTSAVPGSVRREVAEYARLTLPGGQSR